MWLAHSARSRKDFVGPNDGYPKSRQQHDATIDKLESTDTTPIKPSIKLLLLRGIVIIIYLLLGALVFRALEFKERDKLYWNKTLTAEKLRLQREFNISMKTLSRFEYLVHKRIHEVFTENKDWDYYQSLYFASTVTTTIGYGHITPQTSSGRLFLIIFALIGIPLNILALASVGEHITVAIFYFLRYLNMKFFHKQKMKHINIKVMFVTIVMMLVMLFLGGMLYCSTEDWDYIDSIYYCFVAMATIGFGDLVPNRGRAPDTDGEKAIWFLRALYISIGLSLVSTVFTALSNAMEEINLLLGRGKYTKSWLPDHQNQSLSRIEQVRMKDSRPESKESEKISYKHQIHKHGSYVLKYKVFEKFKRKKKSPFTSYDWDRLLADAKRKQSYHSTQSNSHQETAAKPTLLLLAHRSPSKQTRNPNTKEPLLLLRNLPDNDTSSSKISASENGSPISCDNEETFHRYDNSVPQVCSHRSIERLTSTPVNNIDRHYHHFNYSHPINTNSHQIRPSTGIHGNLQTYHDTKYLKGSQNFVPLHMRICRNRPSTDHFLSNQC